jgi:hypothetical protein
MKKFKHKKTGEIITYSDGMISSPKFAIELEHEPSSEYWEEVTECPIGTKVFDSFTNLTFVKSKTGWNISIDESQIVENKRYAIL